MVARDRIDRGHRGRPASWGRHKVSADLWDSYSERKAQRRDSNNGGQGQNRTADTGIFSPRNTFSAK
jgi:hypothetical protein